MGDREPVQKLDQAVREHLPAALQFAIRLTGNVHDGEDVMQEALLRVARSADTFRGDSSFRTWLWRIVINVFRTHTNRATRNDASPLSEDVVAATSDGPGVAMENELSETIAAAISALPPRQREVLVLTGFEGYATADAAEVLGITPQNLYSTLHVARERLRTDLAIWLQDVTE